MPEERGIKEWTLMFYFASDNPLAPGIVSQLKTVKNAGYHHEANVVAYFDPQPVGAPTHIFDVNAIYKLEHPDSDDIGFASNDPFVRDLLEDRLWRDEKDRAGYRIRDLIKERLHVKKPDVPAYDLPEAPLSLSEASTRTARNDHAGPGNDENSRPGPTDSLKSFLQFCADKYQAKHYVLFILGHGLVVGADVFLFDEHAAKHSVTLRELGEVLLDFKKTIRNWGEFELVSFHSCSMSSLEVAFELQDTANYMLASQGPAFVGSWPYRQILIRVFNDLKQKLSTNVEIDVEKMLRRVFDYVYHNSTDYLLAGYCFDLCLCDLRQNRITAVATPIKVLSAALVHGLKDTNNPLVNYCILLAHWKSQSYWEENYTDLYDFCFCLAGYCAEFSKAVTDPKPFERIQNACAELMKFLMPASLDSPNNPVICADFAGPDSQYSHGLSVFFPWTRSAGDRTILKKEGGEKGKTEYEQYKFNQTEWFSFLDQYWGPQDLDGNIKESTMRFPHKDESDPSDARKPKSVMPIADANLFEDIASLMFNADGPLNMSGALSNSSKPNPRDPTGDECSCGSIKNYLRDTRKRANRGSANKSTFPVNQTIFGDLPI